MKLLIHNTADSLHCGQKSRGQITARPAMDLVEEEKGIVLYCNIPGVDPDRLALYLAEDGLHLWGETAFEPAQAGRIHALEFDDMVYEAVFPLPRLIAGATVEARLNNGVLTVLFRLSRKSGPRSIPVNEQ